MRLDSSFGMLETILDLGAARHKALAENVANLDTPGYKAKDVAFEKILQGEMGEGVTLAATNPRHISLEDTEDEMKTRVSAGDEEQGLDGNSVNVEEEMARIAKNNLVYNTAAQAIADRFREVMSAIKGGQ